MNNIPGYSHAEKWEDNSDRIHYRFSDDNEKTLLCKYNRIKSFKDKLKEYKK